MDTDLHKTIDHSLDKWMNHTEEEEVKLFFHFFAFYQGL